MKTLSEKLKDARDQLGLSQEYVAKAIGFDRSVITQIELGNRKVSSEKLAKFCKLYHLSADDLLNSQSQERFAGLTENDQQEILKLMHRYNKADIWAY
ncbi:MAG: helix-turn-helix domain-containing protein [Lachnospiraceae bacterium]|jgi:transcriptional regulator with XRE-family HTH domain|nr:helix-turn-helix domain-containing protein [Lachnospiraceae bacterium]MCH4027618.1 helix-turn-helix domain-containing protein [Lachnospiraceae bacterium]MCH4065458.1 helix-turn-helix domain-containing protein [Lachnospiraceae bacterium]MCH4111498.1 helix-turn-helix domain-containing protein [Lachnospiraceae bacterium]